MTIKSFNEFNHKKYDSDELKHKRLEENKTKRHKLKQKLKDIDWDDENEYNDLYDQE